VRRRTPFGTHGTHQGRHVSQYKRLENKCASNQKFGWWGEFGKSEEEDLRIGESPINES
jgi:hypothetical protein